MVIIQEMTHSGSGTQCPEQDVSHVDNESSEKFLEH